MDLISILLAFTSSPHLTETKIMAFLVYVSLPAILYVAFTNYQKENTGSVINPSIKGLLSFCTLLDFAKND